MGDPKVLGQACLAAELGEAAQDRCNLNEHPCKKPCRMRYKCDQLIHFCEDI